MHKKSSGTSLEINSLQRNRGPERPATSSVAQALRPCQTHEHPRCLRWVHTIPEISGIAKVGPFKSLVRKGDPAWAGGYISAICLFRPMYQFLVNGKWPSWRSAFGRRSCRDHGLTGGGVRPDSTPRNSSWSTVP